MPPKAGCMLTLLQADSEDGSPAPRVTIPPVENLPPGHRIASPRAIFVRKVDGNDVYSYRVVDYVGLEVEDLSNEDIANIVSKEHRPCGRGPPHHRGSTCHDGPHGRCWLLVSRASPLKAFHGRGLAREATSHPRLHAGCWGCTGATIFASQLVAQIIAEQRSWSRYKKRLISR